MQRALTLITICTLAIMHMFPPPATSSGQIPVVQPNAEMQDNTAFRMTDNFFVLYDPSTAMDVPYKTTGLTRIEAQKEILRKSNESMPELNWQAGLYPHWKGGLWLHGSPMAFKPYYRLQRYEQLAYGQAIEALPTTPQSPPMLQTGLMKLEHLLGLPGRTEVFIFSDGQESTFTEQEPFPLEQAQKINDLFDVCFTIISSAETVEGKNLLDKIASLNDCSQVMDFDTVFDNPEHLFGRLYRDGDNLFDNILFDFDKSSIKPEFKSTLDSLGQLLKEKPELYVVLSGFTDSIGTEKYNINLSQKRAESVQKYLRNTFQIQESRLLLYWYGYGNPVASNETAEGRQLNRRVTIALRKQ